MRKNLAGIFSVYASRIHACPGFCPFLPFRGMPSGFFFLAVAGVWQTPLLLRPFRRDLIPISALPTSVLGVLYSASLLPNNFPRCPVPSVSCAREFREREDYVPDAEHKLRFPLSFRSDVIRLVEVGFCTGSQVPHCYTIP